MCNGYCTTARTHNEVSHTTQEETNSISNRRLVVVGKSNRYSSPIYLCASGNLLNAPTRTQIQLRRRHTPTVDTYVCMCKWGFKHSGVGDVRLNILRLSDLDESQPIIQ